MKVLKIFFVMLGCLSLIHCANQAGTGTTTSGYYSSTCYTTGTCSTTTLGTTSTSTGNCNGYTLYYCPYGTQYGASACQQVTCSGDCAGYTLYTSSGQAVACH